MASISLELNPLKALKRSDVEKVGHLIVKAAKDKKVDSLIITITDDRKDGANSMSFPFRIVEK